MNDNNKTKKIRELKAELKKNGLPIYGDKKTLLNRLLNFYNKEESSSLPENVDDDDDDNNNTNIIVQNQKMWDKKFDLLLAYRTREGHCNVPQSHKENGIRLGVWVSRQRKLKKAGQLDSDLEQLLEELGVMWDVNPEKWMVMHRLVVRYQQREGHCIVPSHHKTEDGIGLGSWLKRQKIQRKAGKLDNILEKKLEEIPGFEWDEDDEEDARMPDGNSEEDKDEDEEKNNNDNEKDFSRKDLTTTTVARKEDEYFKKTNTNNDEEGENSKEEQPSKG